MVDFASSTSLCLGNQYCLQWFELLMSSSSARETVSTTFGLVSVLIWLFADIPQLITNFTQKSTDGLSAAFLMMWIIGDLFNLFGCLLEPATLYITLTASLCSQTIYYGYIYPRLKYYRQIKLITSSLVQVSTITFLGIFNLLQSPDTTIHPMGSKPRQEFVLHVGRKLFQDSGYQLSEHGSAGHHSIGNLLGWAMAVLYMSARLPQICLNVSYNSLKFGINPMMFLFAVTGNVTYIASILVRSLEWSRICPNLPWLIEPGGCVLLDLFVSFFYMYIF
uniref:Vacuolar integral membrane protein YDR352W family n=1 Tax=Cajanus cajan TaxID=3821 RepID=A0A151QWJ1_CAJCA|nr:Vacuolar integral membrane protein YDR352W family [Cajanus cajan]